MNFAGCKRKFDVEKYIYNVNKMVKRVKEAAKKRSQEEN